MNDNERDLTDLSDAEGELARRLALFGPVMRELAQAEAEIDPVFARNLRAHLLSDEEGAVHPVVVYDRRSLLLPKRSARPLAKPVRRPPAVWIGAATTALLALLVGVLVTLLLPRGAHVPTITAPYPTRADLIFSFPAPPSVVHLLTPTLSLVHPRSGVPYAGRLRLRAAHLPTGPSRLRAYRLAAPSNVVVVGRQLLGIPSPVRRVITPSMTWIVAAQGGFPSHRPLHSLAVSLDTGELIYHDRRNLALLHAAGALSRSRAVKVARHWLTRLGWPGNSMPLVGVENVARLRKVRAVRFGWSGVGPTATDAATLWVTPNRSVIEAWAWPPVARAGFIASRSTVAAWADVAAGKLPLAVKGVPATSGASGTGSVRRTSVVSVLSPGRPGTLYLVPTYRFEGDARIGDASIHAWFSLAPAGKK